MLPEWLADRGKAWGEVAGLGDVVESNDGYVPWHPDVAHSQGVDHPERHVVVGDDDRVEGRTSLVEQDAHGIHSALVCEVSSHDVRIGRPQPMGGQYLAVRSQPIARVGVALRPAKERDSPDLVVLHQVPDPLSQGLLAVDQDAGHPLGLPLYDAHRQRAIALAIAGELAQAQVVPEASPQDHERVDALRTDEVVDSFGLLGESEWLTLLGADEADEIDS